MSQALPTSVGPGSLLWRWAGDSRIAFMGGAIGLLQLMHPAIGAGVLEHSNFFEDPSGRVFRSLPWILGTVYDEDPVTTGHTVRDFHKSISGVDSAGRRYHALDPATFWWAHATFQYMVEQVADRYDAHRLTRREREQLYAEGVEWYRRYGVSDRCVPATRTEFQREWDRVCAEELEMNEAVRFVLRILDSKQLPLDRDVPGVPARLQLVVKNAAVRRLASYPSRLVAIGGLPRVVRERFGISWTRRDQLALNQLEWTVQRTWFLVPRQLAWQPRPLEAWDRVRRSAAAA